MFGWRNFIYVSMCSKDFIVFSGWICQLLSTLTHKWLETHGCVFSTVATDALVLKHQAISTHSADWTIIVLHKFHTEILQLYS